MTICTLFSPAQMDRHPREYYRVAKIHQEQVRATQYSLWGFDHREGKHSTGQESRQGYGKKWVFYRFPQGGDIFFLSYRNLECVLIIVVAQIGMFPVTVLQSV
jgi:hypothetical protein